MYPVIFDWSLNLTDLHCSKLKTDYMKRTVIVTVVTLFMMLNAEAQVIVKVKPVTPVVIRPAYPSFHHVWVEGSWKWNKSKEITHGLMATGLARASMALYGGKVIGGLPVADGDMYRIIGHSV